MNITAKGSGRDMSIPGGVALGTGIGLVITMILSLATAWLVDRGHIRQDSIGYCAMGILLVASSVGAGTAGRKNRSRKALACMITGLCYFLSLLAMTALFFGGQYSAVGVTGLLVLGGAGTAYLLGAKGNGRGRKGRIPGRKHRISP